MSTKLVATVAVVVALIVIVAGLSVAILKKKTTSGNDASSPSKVTGLSVTDAKGGKLSLTWNASTDDVGVLKYFIYRDGVKLMTEPTVTEYVNSGLTVGISYSYQVSAVDAAYNEGEKSDPATGTPTAGGTPPSKVTGLNVTVEHSGVLTLSWDAATDDGKVDKYFVYRDGTKIGESKNTNYRDTDVSDEVTYVYQVSAVDDSSNEGERSDTVTGISTVKNPAPEFQVTDTDGNLIKNKNMKGGIYYLDFMQTSCSHCQTNTQNNLVPIYQAYSSEITMISISASPSDTNQDLIDFKSAYGAEWQYALDTAGVKDLYGVTLTPTGFLVYKGDIVYTHAGEDSYAALAAEIEALL